jgi:hypothetical protein
MNSGRHASDHPWEYLASSRPLMAFGQYWIDMHFRDVVFVAAVPASLRVYCFGRVIFQKDSVTLHIYYLRRVRSTQEEDKIPPLHGRCLPLPRLDVG